MKNYTSDDIMVEHPKHYQSKNGLEVIQVIEAFTEGLEGIEATDTGNIIKYACRWKDKNGIQDLEKIMWYTQHLIKHLREKESSKNQNDCDELSRKYDGLPNMSYIVISDLNTVKFRCFNEVIDLILKGLSVSDVIRINTNMTNMHKYYKDNIIEFCLPLKALEVIEASNTVNIRKDNKNKVLGYELESLDGTYGFFIERIYK